MRFTVTSENTEALLSPTSERISSSQLASFMQSVKDATGFDAGGDYFALHQWYWTSPPPLASGLGLIEIQGDPGDIVVMTLGSARMSVVPERHTEFRREPIALADDREALVEIDEGDSDAPWTMGSCGEV